MAIVNTVVSLFSIVLLCMTAAQGRKTLDKKNQWLTSYPVTNDIDCICKTMVETQGYTCEEHQVTTKDGYILSLQRIPVGRSGNKADKPPVLLQHGILCDAIIWLINSPEESLGFILADNGYDVWIANTRGTKYSSRHISLDLNDMNYWDWSWDELSSYDLPAFVQYVYNHTGQRIHYAGHSLGTLMALAALCQGQVLHMLRSAALLSPIAHMNQIRSPLVKFAAETFLANDIYWLGLSRFIPYEDVAAKVVEHFCHILMLDCSNLMTLLAGPNCCINSSTTDAFFDHELQPTATKNLIHLSQIIRTGNMAKYDYGDQNMKHYGQSVPPLYDMTGIPTEFPLFLGYGGQDTVSDANDVQVLLNDLKDHDRNKLALLFKENYAHSDFVMGVNANKMIYDPMMAFFKDN